VTNARAFYTTRAAAGALGTRHSPRPHSFGRKFPAQLGRIAPRECGVVSPRHCLRQTQSVCARERLRRSNPFFPCGAMDRFAELAMTVLNLVRPGCLKIESVAIEYERTIPLRPSSPRRRVIAQSETSEKKSRGRGVVDRRSSRTMTSCGGPQTHLRDPPHIPAFSPALVSCQRQSTTATTGDFTCAN
jgi:hypothetical protein